MRISGKGIVIILLFLIVIPLIIDLILSIAFPGVSDNFRMSKLLSESYAKALPFYLFYLVIAFTILFLIKKWNEKKSRSDN